MQLTNFVSNIKISVQPSSQTTAKITMYDPLPRD